MRVNPEFDPQGFASLTTRDYYVFSRVDGSTSVRDLILMVGLEPDETIAIVRKLREAGALLLPGESASPIRQVAAAAFAQGGVPSVASPEVTGAWALKDVPERAGDAAETPTRSLTDEERSALTEDVAIEPDDRRRIIEMRRIIARGDHFEILGVGADAGKREIKLAYFGLSKEFHPDRFYGVSTGRFGPWLAEIFETVSQAYSTLSSPRQRADYEARMRGEARAQTPEEHADELFRQGGEKEAQGELDDALKLFEASIRVRPAIASIRRAAECALRAKRVELAETYARRAAEARGDDPSLQRLLAAIYRAKGELGRAETILVRALESKAASDVLAKELAADLAGVRRARARATDSA